MIVRKQFNTYSDFYVFNNTRIALCEVDRVLFVAPQIMKIICNWTFAFIFAVSNKWYLICTWPICSI